jgi:transglutaminase-like putative cysteine protease
MPAVAPSYFGSIPSGLAGTRATLKIMVGVVRKFLSPTPGDAERAAALLKVRSAAVYAVQRCPEKEWGCEANALQIFVRDNIRYVHDMRQAETIQTPDITLSQRAGDCDDKATLLAAMAECVGFSTRFCAIGVRGEDFSHVSAQLLIPGSGWVNAETIPISDNGGKANLGWFPPDATCLMLAHV